MSAMDTATGETLFRQEAIRSLAAVSLGRPVARMPRAWLLLGGLCLLLLVAVFVFLDRTQYARRERVRGWLVAEQGVARVSHDRRGIAAEIFVVPGQSVDKGDPVLRVTMSRTMVDGSSATEALKQTLRAELAEIDAQGALATRRSQAERRAVETQIASTDEALQRLALEQDAHGDRLQSVARRVAQMQGAFTRGAVSEQQLLGSEEALAAQRQAGAQILQRRAGLTSTRAGLVASLQRISLDMAAEASRLRTARLHVTRELSGVDVGNDVLLTAPIDGEVAAVEVASGAGIVPGQLLVALLPRRYTMAAEVFAPSRAIAGIEAGDTAVLSYDAFPVQRFGIAHARVESISRTVLLPADLPQAFAMREPAYKVRLTLGSAGSDGIARDSLRVGMMLHAEFLLERRSLLQWLLQAFDGLGQY